MHGCRYYADVKGVINVLPILIGVRRQKYNSSKPAKIPNTDLE